MIGGLVAFGGDLANHVHVAMEVTGKYDEKSEVGMVFS